MRYGADHKAATRQRLVEETAEVIRRKGVDAVGVASIMSRLGLTHGGFYAHFASREDLIAAGLKQLFSDGQALFRSQGGELPPAEAVARYIDVYLSRGHRDFAGAACPLPILSADAPRLPGPERERYALAAAGLRGLLAALLGRLGRDDPEGLASSAVAELVGAVTLARAEPDREASDAILARSRAQLKRRLGVETAA